MSTLCRAKWKPRMVRGSRPSRSLCGASRAALPVKDVSGGTPDTARETHALPIHLSAFQKGRVKAGRKISDLFFGKGQGSNQARSTQVIPLFFATLSPCAFAFLLVREGTNQRKVARMQRRKVKPNQSESNQFQGRQAGFKKSKMAQAAPLGKAENEGQA